MPCTCRKVYIEQTGRNININKYRDRSEAAERSTNTKHRLNFEEHRKLVTEPYYWRSWYIEAIKIQKKSEHQRIRRTTVAKCLENSFHT
ncbi:hypothetical protein Trydic_g12223 [Trypoxylus dichotomus]